MKTELIKKLMEVFYLQKAEAEHYAELHIRDICDDVNMCTETEAIESFLSVLS